MILDVYPTLKHQTEKWWLCKLGIFTFINLKIMHRHTILYSARGEFPNKLGLLGEMSHLQ